MAKFKIEDFSNEVEERRDQCEQRFKTILRFIEFYNISNLFFLDEGNKEEAQRQDIESVGDEVGLVVSKEELDVGKPDGEAIGDNDGEIENDLGGGLIGFD